jgi:ubiquinone/menaquinone biosynthesis C-methylase UbiE
MPAQEMNNHFTKIADCYRSLRTTDIDPIDYICNQTKLLNQIKVADVGCGDGRYDLELLKRISDKIETLFCLDANKEMLAQAERYLTSKQQTKFKTIQAESKSLPFPNSSLDMILTFNAIHHFDTKKFLKECSRVLKPNGFLFIYTRLTEQNQQTIWGRYFPSFNEKETRLFHKDFLPRVIKEIPNLSLEDTQVFAYKRKARLDELIKRAKNHHYSTFYLYKPDELDKAINQFKENLSQSFDNLDNVNWEDQNIMYLVRNVSPI